MDFKPLLITALLVTSLPAAASNPFKPMELTDSELAQLRGRYVLPDRIVSFGVTMSSSWQNSAGQVIGATVALNVMGGQLQPTLSFTPINQSGNGSQPLNANGQIIGGAGLHNMQGVAQSVRTAGDFNQGVNDLRIDFSKGASGSVPAGGMPLASGQSFSNAAGTVMVTTLNGGLQLGLQASHGQGHTQQQIGQGSVAQHAAIGGSMNNVHNVTTLNIALRDSSPRTNMASSSWEQLRALRRTGY